MNLTAKTIDLFAKYGAVYDLKEASATMIKNRCLRTGDKTHERYGDPELKESAKETFKPKLLSTNGHVLFKEELHMSELDDELLIEENKILQSQRNLNCDDNVSIVKRIKRLEPNLNVQL
jgi:hypothetical protein